MADKTLNQWTMFTRWNQGLGDLFNGNQKSDPLHQLIRVLESIVPVDEPLMLIVIRDNKSPYIIAPDKEQQRLQGKYTDYLKHLFFLDPCYRSYRERSYRGFYQFSELSPKGFSCSEIYRNFYRKNFLDEMGYIFSFGENNFVTLCASRIQNNRFSSDELEFYKGVTPVIESILERYFEESDDTKIGSSNSLETMERTLETFCRDRLSNREHDILQLILRGFSMQEMSDKLNRSIYTIKKHHSMIYEKLGISSQREIIPLLIRALENALEENNPEVTLDC